ncbi:XRE family transcriptional regulator [Achromobacter insolitus]|uniref:XRE family transcriptional regulator n=1 Tax=Achromobacter insolitus TaxID=217204 RepID=UPI0013F4F5D4|nr:LexA family transcriptional regulator [Achromobacter insolitus]
MSKPTLNEILATNLARLMEKTGHKQASLAAASGVGQTTISLYLNPGRRQPSKSGKVPSAKFGEVEALADALGVMPWDLLRPDDDEQVVVQAPRRPISPRAGGLVDMDHADDPFPMRIAGLPPAPWEGGKTTKQMERESHGLRISQAINVGHVEDSGYSANDHEFVPIPELDVRLAAGKLGIENYQETEIGQILLRRSFLESFKRPIKRMRICYGDGPSMEPVIRHRNPMLLDVHPVSLEDVRSRFVYAINRGGKMIVKCLERWRDGTWMAISTNPDPAYRPFPLELDDGGDVRIIGTVLWSPYDLRNGVDERLLLGWRQAAG